MGILQHARDPVYANGAALVLNAGASAALGFLFWMVAARRFQPDALGIGAAVVSAASLAALVGRAGFDAAVVRFVPSADRAGVRRLLRRAMVATLGLTCAVALAILLVAKLGVPSLAPLVQPAFALGFVALALGTSAAWILDACFVAQQRAGFVLLRNIAFNLGKLLVPLLIVYEWGGRAIPLAWGVGLAASLTVALVVLPRALARHEPQGAPPTEGALAYSLRNYAINLSEFLPGLLLPILVLHELGAEANARFYLAWTLAAVAFLAAKAIAQSAFAALVRPGDPRGPLRKAGLLSAAVLLPGALVLYAGAPLLLALFGPAYAGGAPLLRILALSIPFVAATNLYLAYLKARDARWEITFLPLASLLAVLVVMPVALARGGIEAAGFAWLAVQAAAGVFAAARLLVRIRRIEHGTSHTRLRRHPHQG